MLSSLRDDPVDEPNMYAGLTEEEFFARLQEEKRIRERLSLKHPDVLKKLGRALAEDQTRLAIEVLTSG